MTAEHVVGTCKPHVLAAVIGQQDPLPRHLLQVRAAVTIILPCVINVISKRDRWTCPTIML